MLYFAIPLILLIGFILLKANYQERRIRKHNDKIFKDRMDEAIKQLDYKGTRKNMADYIRWYEDMLDRDN